MHMLSTVMREEIVNVYEGCAGHSGSASGNLMISSPDIPCLQAARVFVVLATFKLFERTFAD